MSDLKQIYWQANLKYVSCLMSLWALVSLGFGVLWVDYLDQYQIGGFPLGFWFAQQGAIYTFILITIVYVVLMNRLDRRLAKERIS